MSDIEDGLHLLVLLLELPGLLFRIDLGLNGPVAVGPEPDVHHQVGQLEDENEGKGDTHDDGLTPPLVDHERGQPAAEAVGPGGDHEEEADNERKQQEHGGPATEGQPEREAQHGREDGGDAETDEGGHVVEQEDVA